MFERMKEIYRQARHISELSKGMTGEQIAVDTFALIDELCNELARVTGKVSAWAEFKKSLN
jgi:hypothetical protein